MNDEVKTLVSNGYFVCGTSESCCDTVEVGGTCCTVCESCISSACVTKADGVGCGSGNVCCSGVCSAPPCV